jgi:UDP-N-acetylmuramyl tripeptide synthase
MIAINDNYADGRDMSWLWDVDFDSLQNQGVAMVSGVRAYDMALRLQYDEVEVTSVEPLLPAALAKFINAESDKPKRIFCTYTAMLAIRRELSKKTNVEVVR